MHRRIILVLSLFAVVAGCGEDKTSESPPPATLSRDAVGYYCGMIVEDHMGPKGQIHLESRDEPVWFTSVRDTIAFTMLPEEADDITAIYVHDIAEAASWDHPGHSSWMSARDALYVVGSSRRGGMGAPETVPFSDREAAERFAGEHGGRVVSFEEIPEDAVLGHVGGKMPEQGADGAMEHDE